ncbi:unnamed protein product [Brugia pahangi]|uniref:Sec7_N domain-containing protein n=1 Tax=Brugia pahangi TaxID=6280 RepID=A0A0N4TQ72_BRUPA|nr:unnamed protein product [Brugia pahangi]
MEVRFQHSVHFEIDYKNLSSSRPRSGKYPSVANREKFLEYVKYLLPLISEEFLSHADKTTRWKATELLSHLLSSCVNRMRVALTTDQRVSHCLITRNMLMVVLIEIKSHRPGSCSI